MKFNAISRRAMTGIGLASAVIALPAMAQAQTSYPAPMSQSEVQSLPPEYRTGPVVEDYTETTVDEYGVETVTRTRRIETRAPYTESGHTGDYEQHYEQGYAPQYAPAASVFEREQWIDECENRTNGSSGREKGGIIGGLLGAIAGGIVGNRVSDGERLGGTLIGAGVGGIGGLLIGSLIGGGRDDRGNYDCEAALDSYISQYGYPGAHVAARTIPAPRYAQHYGYGYAPQYQAYSYTYAPPQQVVYVPVRYEQQQRVIVRETVREETVPVAARAIPAPRPAPAPVPAPRYEPRYVKGN